MLAMIIGPACMLCLLIGVLAGQHSVWRDLRKKGSETIGDWTYYAENWYDKLSDKND